jgi:hypothetical protein
MAKTHLNKATNNYKDFDLEDRLQTQMRCLQKRIKYLNDDPKLEQSLKEREEIEKEIKLQKQINEKNFFL